MNRLLGALREGRPVPLPGIVDTHGHLGRYGFGIPETQPEALVAQMDRCGVRSIVVSHMHCMKWDWTSLIWGNEEIHAATKRHPGRVLGYFCVLPTDEKKLREEFALRLSQGFVGIKIHNGNGFNYTHRGYEPLWDLANQAALPILFHTWGGNELDELARIAERWPRLRPIAAHAGSRNIEAYIALAKTHPNLFLDTCFSRSPRGVVERLVREAGSKKILWGSDAHFYSMSQQLGRVVGANLTEEELTLLLQDNARALFSLKGEKG